MKNNYLKYCLFPVVLFIALIVFNTLAIPFRHVIFSSMGFEMGELISLLKLMFNIYNLRSSLINYLPVLAVAMLFTMQYQHLKIDLRSIIYIGIICLVYVSVMSFFKPWTANYLKDYLDFPWFDPSLFLAWGFICYILVIAIIGVVSHYYFRNCKVSELAPLSTKVTIVLIVITQAIFVNYLCELGVFYSMFWYMSQSVLYTLVYLVVFLINAVVLFVYFYTWNSTYLSACRALDNFALKTTISLVIMSGFMLLFCAVYGVIFAMLMSLADYDSIFAILIIGYLIGFAVFVFMVSQSKSIAYLIICCLAYFAPLIVCIFIDISYTLFIYGAYVGLLSISLFSWYISSRLSLRLAFK